MAILSRMCFTSWPRVTCPLNKHSHSIITFRRIYSLYRCGHRSFIRLYIRRIICDLYSLPSKSSSQIDSDSYF